MRLALLLGITSLLTYCICVSSKIISSNIVIGASCAIETLLPDGSYNEASTRSCGECFNHPAIQKLSVNAHKIVKNCSFTYLPKIANLCTAHLGQDQTEFAEYFEGVLFCFQGYLWGGFGNPPSHTPMRTRDEDKYTQKGVKKWMKDHFKNVCDSKKKWEFLLYSSCLVESRLNDGSFDYYRAKICGECFNELDQFKNCTEFFLPYMARCVRGLPKRRKENTFLCFNNHLLAKDVGGEARKLVKEWMGEEDGWMDEYMKTISFNKNKWEFLIGSSCFLESYLRNGSFDYSRTSLCMECFEELGHIWIEDSEQMYNFQNCTETFLPNMASCAQFLIQRGEEDTFVCFNEYLIELDYDGVARKTVKKLMEEHNSNSV